MPQPGFSIERGGAESEESLLVRLRRAEPSAIADVYDAHQGAVHGFARRLLGDAAAAQDAVHDVFVALGEERLRIELRRRTGGVDVRTVDVPTDRDLAAETAAFAASNLARDEADEILATLAPPPPPPSPASAPQTAPAVVAAPAPARSPCAEAWHVPFGADVVPFVGTSSFQGDEPRATSLHLVVGRTRGVHGFQLGAGANIASSFMCGAQVAGGANVAVGRVRGAQVAVGNLMIGHIDGVQLGVIDVAAGGTLTAAEEADPKRTALRGAQIGVVNANIASAPLAGAQIGVANFGLGEVRGVQLGVVNVAGGASHGAQIGVVNYADTAEAPIGVVSIVRHGRTAIETWGTESGLVMGGVRHGGSLVHNVYGAGYRVGSEGRGVVALGIGVHIELVTRGTLDVDAIEYELLDGSKSAPKAHIAAAQFAFGYAFTSVFGVFAAPSFNVGIVENGAYDLKPIWSGVNVASGKDTEVRLWPGLSLGLRAML